MTTLNEFGLLVNPAAAASPDGRLQATTRATLPTDVFAGGLRRGADGRLYVSTGVNEATDVFIAGLRATKDGILRVDVQP